MAFRSAKRAEGMIFLDDQNPIVKEAIGVRTRAEDPLREPCEIRSADFDKVNYMVNVGAEAPSVMTLHAALPGLDVIRANGGQEVLDREFPGMEVEAGDGFDVAVQFDLDTLVGLSQEDVAAATDKFSRFKRLMTGAPLERACSALEGGSASSLPIVSLPYRSGEMMYVVGGNDRVTVVFSVDFSDRTDQTIARTFLQSFPESQRKVNNSPPCSFSPDPPQEIQSVVEWGDDHPQIAGFISFTLFAAHVGDRKDKTIKLITGFRNYLHYHIKASKTYLHMRMRRRVNNMLQVLQRAVPEPEAKEKKTAKGKTFKRSFKK